MRLTLAGTGRVPSLAWHVDYRGPNRRAGLRQRLLTLQSALGGHASEHDTTSELLSLVESLLVEPTPDRIWLALAVLRGQLPDRVAVLETTRRARLDGSLAALADAIVAPRAGWPLARGAWPRVEVVTRTVLIDLQHTAHSDLATGIQRVARQVATRWCRDHSPLLVGWTPSYTGLRRLDPAERAHALYGDAERADGNGAHGYDVIVPWKCTYVLPELMTEPERARRLRALCEYSGCESGLIGFDCVPLTSAETIADGMGAGFAMMLATAAQSDRIATISEASAVEYRGWRSMLAGAGLAGPDIAAIPLAVEAETPTAEAMAEVRKLIGVGTLPMVLAVGSHEPRKNHLAVLHAAELLWRDSLQFNLVFVGGNGWLSERFAARLHELQGVGRPVLSLSALPDELLWAAYRIARCTVFPSLNEGFGLPVAESLASGTPAVTSDFGSMREIAANGGVLLVDPHDDHAIADALRRLLTDDELHAAKSSEALTHATRSWDEYAAEVWRHLVEGGRAETTSPSLANVVER